MLTISVLPGKEVRAIDKEHTGFPGGDVEKPVAGQGSLLRVWLLR